jgi:hypothetical protein
MDVAVTQATSTATAVTANGSSGLITCFTSVLAGAASVTFTVNNTATDADSVVLVSICNYSAAVGIPTVRVNNCVAGTSFDIIVTNAHASVALAGVLKIGFLLQ